MTNEPKAAGDLDPEMLAAYIDQRLPPDERAVVEARLATDPDSYELLVELIHANEALKDPAEAEPAKAPGARAEEQATVVPLVPKPARTRTWAIAGGVLAAAAALVLVARLQPELLQRLRGGDAVDPQLAKLVAAVGEERYIEARLTGGFKYGPLRSVTRGPGDLSQQNLALIAAAGELQKAAEDSPTAESRRHWAVAQLLVGQSEGAAAALQEVINAGNPDARVYSDAAAASLEAAAAGSADQLSVALDLASRAARMDPQLAEASFNRALALERLSLTAEALSEWRRFLTIETNVSWLDDARRHIVRLEGQSSSEKRVPVPSTLGEVTAASGAILEQLIRDDAPGVRAVLEGVLLIEATGGTGMPIGYSDRVRIGQSLAGRFQDVTGDPLPSLIWNHAATASRPALIAQGFGAYLAGRNLLKTNEVSAAEREFKRGATLLTAAGSPGAALTDFFLAHTAYYLGRTTEAAERLRPLVQGFVASEFTSLAIRALYLQGLCELRFGQHSAVIVSERRAAALAQRTGDRVMEIVARSEVADAFDRLALATDSWRERVLVLGLAARLADRNVSHVTLGAASRSAATNGQYYAARDFAEAMLRNAEEWRNVAAEAEARLRLADAAHRAQDNATAATHLDDANLLLDRMPDAQANGSRIDAEMLRAAIQLESSPVDALRSTDRAFEILARRESPFRLARAKWLRGRALAGTQPVLAKQEFLDGLQAAQSSPSAVDPFGRSLAEQRSALLRELVRLPIGEDDQDALLNDVVSVLTGRVESLILEKIRSSLKAGDVLLVLVALDDELVRWCVTTGETTRTAAATTRAELSRRVASYSRSMTDPGSSNWALESIELSELLLAPLASAPGRLLLVTDAVLADVPFSTLTIPGRTGMIADSTEVVILASQGGAGAAPGGHRRDPGRILVVGDPDLQASDSVLPRLPGARAEAEEVAALYPAATIELGEHATKAVFLRDLPNADVVHFSGHALGNRADPAMSRLLLAGTNGEVTASDVLGLRLRARLVVLGACEGALAAKAGDSPVFGLAQAFLRAGVSAVVASRWKVADGSSRHLLVQFHRHLLEGDTPAAALRAAQIELRQTPNFQHPFYWAGFALYTEAA